MKNDKAVEALGDMTDTDFAAVQTAVTLAKDRQIQNTQALRSAIVREGFTQEEAGRAVVFLGGYERSKTPRQNTVLERA